jgi:hypothetical protein
MLRLRRCSTIGIFLVLALVLNSPLVEAGRLWCKADPVVTIDERVVSISLAIPLEYLLLVDGPTVVEITIPESVDRQVIVNDVGFLHGSIVTFKDGGTVKDSQIPVQINASVSINRAQLAPGEDVPFEMTVLTDGLMLETVRGTTDGIKMKFVLDSR